MKHGGGLTLGFLFAGVLLGCRRGVFEGGL
jgi:hypothetical protein